MRPDGTAPIYFVIRVSSKDKLISTGKYIVPIHFDNKEGAAKKGANNAMKLNAYLQKEKGKLMDTILDLQLKGNKVTHERVIDLYKKGGKNNFISFCREELNKEKGIVAHKTFLQHNSSLNNLEKYSPGVTIHEIDYDFLRKYEYYLKNVKGRVKNGYYHDFATIRKFFKIAAKRGVSNSYPFDQFSFGTKEVEKGWHTLEELDSLYDLLYGDTLSEKLKHTLVYYLIACNTGLRLGDITRLSIALASGRKEKYIINGAIHLTQGKGKKINRIPLTNKAKELLNYNFDRPLKQSNSRIGDDLTEIMVLAKIDKHITFHCSRHTFAINALRKGVTLKALSQILGHSSAKTTEIYAKYVDEGLDSEMDKLN